MKKLLVLFLILLVLAVGAIFYLLRPKTLGVTYTPQDLESINKKLGVAFETLPTDAPKEKTLVFTGSHKVDTLLSSEELTAVADKRHEQFPLFPFRNVQIRVNPDGSVEGSGTINYKDALNYLVALGVSPSDVARGAEKFKIPNTNIPVYLKVTGSIVNNESTISVSSAKAAGISVPENLLNEYAPALNVFIESILKERSPNYNIESLKVVGNKIQFKGSSPDLEQAARSF